MNSVRDVERFLKENKFFPVKRTKTGIIYGDGNSTVMFSPTRVTSGRNIKDLETDVQRAVALRPPSIMEVEPCLISREPTLKVTLREAAFKVPEKPAIIVKPVQAPKAVVSTPAVVDDANSEAEFSFAKVDEEPRKRAKAKIVRRHTSAQRIPIWRRIKELSKTISSQSAIAAVLNSEGLRMSNGDPIDCGYVSHAQVQLEGEGTTAQMVRQLEEFEASKTSAAALPPGIASAVAPESPKPVVDVTPASGVTSVPAAILSILTDPKADELKKYRMIAGYVSVARAKVDPTFVAIVEDSELAVSEKLAMLVGFLE